MFKVGDLVDVDPTPKNVEVIPFIMHIKLGELYRVEGVEVDNNFAGGYGVKVLDRWYGSTWFRLHKKGALKRYFDV